MSRLAEICDVIWEAVIRREWNTANEMYSGDPVAARERLRGWGIEWDEGGWL